MCNLAVSNDVPASKLQELNIILFFMIFLCFERVSFFIVMSSYRKFLGLESSHMSLNNYSAA